MLIERTIKAQILQKLIPNKVIVLVGPRRVGKTILLNQLIESLEEPYLYLNGEDFTTLNLLEIQSIQNYKNLLANNKILIIDEAQKIPNIGAKLKLMIDNIEGVKIIISGSSAFDISNKIGEPLTGRKSTFNLYAFSEKELNQVEDTLTKKANLSNKLVFGNYPELLHLSGDVEKGNYLKEIVNSYLLKDILAFDGIRNSDKIFALLRLIAYQIGSEVSLQELGKQLAMSKNTVEKYLDLLSKFYVIHKVSGFSRNLRKEVTKNSKWYFYDNGIRNLIIANVNSIENRNDIGVLWENYMIGERLKFQSYNNMIVNNFFWRTYDQQEIDWVEERGGKLYAYEIKWNPSKKVKVPTAWKKEYVDAHFDVINQNNYLEWLGAVTSQQ